MRKHVKRWCGLALVVSMLNTAACGYLIYPERQGLRGDRVDGTVVALDAIGLLLLLPGIIAFAVDFSTGCIYLPEDAQGSFSANESSPKGWVPVAQVAPFADEQTIAVALQKYLYHKGEQNGRWMDRRAEASTHIEWLSPPPPSYLTVAAVH